MKSLGRSQTTIQQWRCHSSQELTITHPILACTDVLSTQLNMAPGWWFRSYYNLAQHRVNWPQGQPLSPSPIGFHVTQSAELLLRTRCYSALLPSRPTPCTPASITQREDVVLGTFWYCTILSRVYRVVQGSLKTTCDFASLWWKTVWGSGICLDGDCCYSCSQTEKQKTRQMSSKMILWMFDLQ
jgi:hypothetical protein